jgi:tetratricopeptide (TPR) repeat protein
VTPLTDPRPYLPELERFADGLMLPAEQEAFEVRLENEPALAEAHAAYEQLTADLRWAAGHDTLRQRLHALDQRMNQRGHALLRTETRTRQRKRRVAVLGTLGAVLLLALAMGAWWLSRPAGAAAQRNWKTYYQPDAGPVVTPALRRSHPLLSQAFDQYRAGHFPAAMYSLGRVSQDKVSADTLQYYHGLILMRQGEGAAAQAYLRRVATDGPAELARRARYHLGMAYWQTQQHEQALDLLRQVAADSLNPYRASANRALNSGALQPR